jgi:alkanesulfonate monooxygenase SsuD/methylene tetrahydromethanopterin reductase-like flavin-dependent oxidoreductase (luciferase family)
VAAEGDAVAESIMQSARTRWLVGTGPEVRAQVADFAARHGVDEVMISPVAGSFDSEAMDASPGRLQTLELLAA